MALQDELLTQKIEVLLDIQAKRMKADIQLLRDELSQVKEELRKEIHSIKQDPSYTPAGSANVQMYADVPPVQQAPEQVPRYAQQQQAPPQYQQAPQYQQQQYQQQPQQNYPQQNYPQQQYPQGQQQQGYPQAGRMDRDAPPVAKPIDRNNVAPSEVSVEKFFYMGGKANKK